MLHKKSLCNEPDFEYSWNPPEQRERDMLDFYHRKFRAFKTQIQTGAYDDYQLLPLFYLLPEDISIKMGYGDFPRTLHGFLSSGHWVNVFYSAEFYSRLQSAIAFLIWPYFGVRGHLEHYAGDNYFYITAHNLAEWYAWLKHVGFDCAAYTYRDPDQRFEYFTYDEGSSMDINRVMKITFQLFRATTDYDDIREVILSHSAIEDYSELNSRAKTDWYRKHYHSRTKIGVMLPLEDVAERTCDYGERLDGTIDFASFLGTLSEKDRRIVLLTAQKYTQSEIAEQTGYANNSGIAKRIRLIAGKYLDYIK